MQTIGDYIEETSAHTLTKEEYRIIHSLRPPMIVHFEGGTERPDNADTLKFGTISIVPRNYPLAVRDLSVDPFYWLEKNTKRNAFGMFITLGRAQNNDIIVPGQHVSKLHALIQKGTCAYTLSDCSTNGTQIELADKVIVCRKGQTATLEDGCIIKLGEYSRDKLIYLANVDSIYDYLIRAWKSHLAGGL